MKSIKQIIIAVKNAIIVFFKSIFHFFGNTFSFIGSWWRAILLILILVLCLYYPIGGFMMHKIYINTDYNITQTDNPYQSATVDTMAYIIDQEVNKSIWIPNLPFFFPSYFLDNMPNFQLGMFDALTNFSYAFRNAFEKDSPMKDIFEHISYNGKIWMFSPENKITPVSSANKMYREAYKMLNKFNADLGQGTITFQKKSADLSFILAKTNQNLQVSVDALEKHINENSSKFIDLKSDDTFFYHQGKIYAYYLLLNALERDYRNIILETNQYQNWTVLTKSLADGSNINPLIIRNCEIDGSFAPNHLMSLAFYAQKAGANIQRIIIGLERVREAL